MTRRRWLEYWTEVKRVVGGEVVQTTCCCAEPGSHRRACSDAAGNKTPCRCQCHKGSKAPAWADT